MAGDSFGKIFQIHNWGESHGVGIGVVVTGCPANISITEKDIQHDLDRRRPHQSKITSQRNEPDTLQILSGVFHGKTTGAPIHLFVANVDAKKKDYHALKQLYRPSHADFTYHKKYGVRDPYGGGRSSARLMAANVAAAAIAKKILHQKRIRIFAYVESIKHLRSSVPIHRVTPTTIEKSVVRCPDKKISQQMIELVTQLNNKAIHLVELLCVW